MPSAIHPLRLFHDVSAHDILAFPAHLVFLPALTQSLIVCRLTIVLFPRPSLMLHPTAQVFCSVPTMTLCVQPSILPPMPGYCTQASLLALSPTRLRSGLASPPTTASRSRSPHPQAMSARVPPMTLRIDGTLEGHAPPLQSRVATVASLSGLPRFNHVSLALGF